MSDLQWQKDRCTEWLLDRWTACVPLERTKHWLQRIGTTASDRQLAETIWTIGELSDEAFARWLLDEAEPWQQSLALDTVRRLQRWIEAAMPGDAIIATITLHMRDGDSLRTVVHLGLAAGHPSR